MGALRVLITGASGLLGRACVDLARREGHRVFAVIRRAESAPAHWQGDDGIIPIVSDLRTPSDALIAAIAEADATLHCAAALSGDPAVHKRDTLEATEALLAALPAGHKLVHVSSIAVYDYAGTVPGSLIDEATPLEPAPEARDAYAAAKLAQEAMVRARSDLQLTVLRPGGIWTKGALWNAHLGRMVGPVLLRFASRGQIPLAHLALAARASVAALTAPATDVINVVDDDLPDRIRFLSALHNGPKLILPLPSALLAPVMSEQTRAARYWPFGFDNTRMHDVLGVMQAKGFERLMHEAQS